MQYALLIYTPEPTEEVPEDVMSAELDGYAAFTKHLVDRGVMKGGEALEPTSTATTSVSRTGDDHDRRSLRRDQGDARRLLPRRGRGSRRGDRLRGHDPGREERLHRGPAGVPAAGRLHGGDRTVGERELSMRPTARP